MLRELQLFTAGLYNVCFYNAITITLWESLKINKYNISSGYVINIIFPIQATPVRTVTSCVFAFYFTSIILLYCFLYSVYLFSNEKFKGRSSTKVSLRVVSAFFWYKCGERQDWPSQLNTQLKQLWNHSLKKIQIQPWTGFELMTSVILVQCSAKWTIKPIGSCSLFDT